MQGAEINKGYGEMIFDSWETECPACLYIFGGRISQVPLFRKGKAVRNGKLVTVSRPAEISCRYCGHQFFPEIVSPAGMLIPKPLRPAAKFVKKQKAVA